MSELGEVKGLLEALRKEVAEGRVEGAEIRSRLRSIERRLEQIDQHVSQGANALTTRVAMNERRLDELAKTVAKREEQAGQGRAQMLAATIAGVLGFLAAATSAVVQALSK